MKWVDVAQPGPWCRCVVTGIVLALSGCASTPVPTGYTGPMASLRDTVRLPEGKSCGDFFFLVEYNGKTMDNAVDASAKANAGNGMIMGAAQDFSRAIPAQKADFHIAGRTHCAAPIQEMLGTVYLVDGHIEFTPEPDASYVIKGLLGPERSAVWIENGKTGLQTGDKLLVEGPAKAGFFGGKGKVVRLPPPQ